MKVLPRLAVTLTVGAVLCGISLAWANPPPTSYTEDTGATYQGYLQGGGAGYGLIAGSQIVPETTDWIRYDVWANYVDDNPVNALESFTYQYTVRLDMDSTDRSTIHLEDLVVSISALENDLGYATILGTPEYWTGNAWADVSSWAYLPEGATYTNIPPAVVVGGEDAHDAGDPPDEPPGLDALTYSYRFDSEYVPRWGDVEINLLWYTDGPGGADSEQHEDDYFTNNGIDRPPEGILPPEYPELEASAVIHSRFGVTLPYLWQGWWDDSANVVAYDILTPDSVRVPEPTSATLLGLLLATGLLRRTRRRRA